MVGQTIQCEAFASEASLAELKQGLRLGDEEGFGGNRKCALRASCGHWKPCESQISTSQFIERPNMDQNGMFRITKN